MKNNMKNILVTGVAGFIGYHPSNKLLERGDEVIGIDNLNNYYDIALKYARLNELGIKKEEIKGNIVALSKTYSKHKFIKMDLVDQTVLLSLFNTENFDAVCNLAAQAGVRYSLEISHAYIDSNTVGLLNLLEICRHNNMQGLCFASGSSVYRLNESQPFNAKDHTNHPLSLYAAANKLEVRYAI